MGELIPFWNIPNYIIMDKNTILQIFLNTKEKMDHEANILETNLDNLKKQGDEGGFLSKGRKRKSKWETVDQRNYVCGCGKPYLSYPALYTHIKNKHNKATPEGTTFDSQAKDIQKMLEQERL